MSAFDRAFDETAMNEALTAAILRLRLIAFDFDGVFTDNKVFVFEDGREAVRCSRADGMGLAKLLELGIEPMIISTEVNPVVDARSRKLDVVCFSGCGDKKTLLQTQLDAHGLVIGQAGFVGNDVNDLACLETVGLPMVVRDAHPAVLPHGLYRTMRNGGDGAVREICDLIAAVRLGGKADD